MKMTKSLSRLLALGGSALLLGLGAAQAPAQEQRPDRGDPEQFRQRMMERYREQLEVKSDDEWKLIEQRITKVFEARRELGSGNRGGFGRGGGGGGGGRRGGDGANNAGDNNDRRRGGGGGEASPDEAALQAALDAKASPDDLKAKLAKVRASRKEKQAKLEKAQDELRQVLSVRQEALAVMNGLLS